LVEDPKEKQANNTEPASGSRLPHRLQLPTLLSAFSSAPINNEEEGMGTGWPRKLFISVNKQEQEGSPARPTL
jgi:hypothetical protein